MPGGGAGDDARRLDAEQVGEPLAAPVEELRHRGERPVDGVHGVADGGREDRAAEIGVDAGGIDHRAHAQRLVDSAALVDRSTVQQSRPYYTRAPRFKRQSGVSPERREHVERGVDVALVVEVVDENRVAPKRGETITPGVVEPVRRPPRRRGPGSAR